MNEVLERLGQGASTQTIRHFYLAEVMTEGPWILKRLLHLYPNQNERSLIGWLRGVIDNNAYLCLYQPHGACFAERATVDELGSKYAVRELFCWCEDPKDEVQVANALAFYDYMANWAKFQNIDKLIVCEHSDVPHAAVAEKFGGKLREVRTYFARV